MKNLLLDVEFNRVHFVLLYPNYTANDFSSTVSVNWIFAIHVLSVLKCGKQKYQKFGLLISFDYNIGDCLISV